LGIALGVDINFIEHAGLGSSRAKRAPSGHRGHHIVVVLGAVGQTRRHHSVGKGNISREANNGKIIVVAIGNIVWMIDPL